MHKRLTDTEKNWMFSDYKKNPKPFTHYAKKLGVTGPAIRMWFKKAGIKAIPQSILQRKYKVDEEYFNNVDSQDKAYIIGFLYADGWNSESREAVYLSLKEEDKYILDSMTRLLQPKKPLRFIKKRKDSYSNSYRLCIENLAISKQLKSLGVLGCKTFLLKFPEWLESKLIPHFIRGYMDGDGWVGVKSCSLVGTTDFCAYISKILSTRLGITTYTRTRHPDRNHNIRQLEVNGRLQTIKFLDWIYKNANLYLFRKYDRYQDMKQRKFNPPKRTPQVVKVCIVEGCNKKHSGKGYCRNHYYEFYYDQ